MGRAWTRLAGGRARRHTSRPSPCAPPLRRLAARGARARPRRRRRGRLARPRWRDRSRQQTRLTVGLIEQPYRVAGRQRSGTGAPARRGLARGRPAALSRAAADRRRALARGAGRLSHRRPARSEGCPLPRLSAPPAGQAGEDPHAGARGRHRLDAGRPRRVRPVRDPAGWPESSRRSDTRHSLASEQRGSGVRCHRVARRPQRSEPHLASGDLQPHRVPVRREVRVFPDQPRDELARSVDEGDCVRDAAAPGVVIPRMPLDGRKLGAAHS
jgi:hypothetical protein